MPATGLAKRTASRGASPRVRATASPPLKASPAPVVSTTAPASIDGTCSENLPPCSRAPLSPSVTITVPTPRSDRKRVVEGKHGEGRVDLVGTRIIKQKKQRTTY